MKTRNTTPTQTVHATILNEDSSKLVSLLALATGAVAMPQTGNADIIFTDLGPSGVTVGYSGSSVDSYMFSLPGTAQFGIKRFQDSSQFSTTLYGLTYTYFFQSVYAASMGTGTAAPAGLQAGAGFAAALNAGNTWDALGLGLYAGAAMGTGTAVIGAIISSFDLNPPGGFYPDRYMAWAFIDSTQGGMMLYGWAEVSMLMANYPEGPNVTILRYAYDDSGAKPFMGQMPIPEPSSAGLLVLGALAVGSRGLRAWRRNRPEIRKS